MATIIRRPGARDPRAPSQLEQWQRMQSEERRRTVKALDWAVFFVVLLSIGVACVPVVGVVIWFFIPAACLVVFILGIVQVCKGGIGRGVCALIFSVSLLPAILYYTPIVSSTLFIQSRERAGHVTTANNAFERGVKLWAENSHSEAEIISMSEPAEFQGEAYCVVKIRERSKGGLWMIERYVFKIGPDREAETYTDADIWLKSREGTVPARELALFKQKTGLR